MSRVKDWSWCVNFKIELVSPAPLLAPLLQRGRTCRKTDTLQTDMFVDGHIYTNQRKSIFKLQMKWKLSHLPSVYSLTDSLNYSSVRIKLFCPTWSLSPCSGLVSKTDRIKGTDIGLPLREDTHKKFFFSGLKPHEPLRFWVGGVSPDLSGPTTKKTTFVCLPRQL